MSEIISEDKITKLEKQGWSRWTKGNFDHLYFNVRKADVLGLEYHTTGTINNAIWDGKEISNGEARRILPMKAYVDIPSGKFQLDTTEMATQTKQKCFAKQHKIV